MSLITIKNLTVSYDGRAALKDFNCQIGLHQITALVGPNGSGKSTLIKALAGILPFKGQIEYSRTLPKCKLSTGYVPQRFEIDLSLPITVYELLELSLVTCHCPHNKQFITDSLTKVHLSELISTKLHNLSGGQLQRVLLARAIVHQPKLLLLDEPEAGLDAHSQESFYKLLVDLAKQDHMTVVLASHNLETVSTFANQVITMDND